MLLKQNQTAHALKFLLVSATDGTTPLTGLGSAPVAALSKGDGSFGAAAGAVSELGNGWYKIAKNAADFDTLGSIIIHATATGAAPADHEDYQVVAFDPDALAATVAGYAANQDPATYIDNNSQLAANIEQLFALPYSTSGTCTGGSTTTIVMQANNSSTHDGAYVGQTIRRPNAVSETEAERRIIGYVASTHTITVDSAWAAPISGETYDIIPILAPDNASIAAILAKLSGMTSLPNWLRAMTRKDAPDATAQTEINANTNSINGTYDATTDANQALRDRGDAAWVTGSGGGGGGLSGPSSVTLTFHDANASPVSNVEFTVAGQGTMRTGSNGIAAFGLSDGTYTVTASPVGLVMFSNSTLTVGGTTASTITGTAVNIPAPSGANQVTGYLTTRDGQDAPTPSVTLTFEICDPKTTADAFNLAAFTATSDSAGLLTVPLRKNTAYRAKTAGSQTWRTFTTGTTTPYAIPEILGAFA